MGRRLAWTVALGLLVAPGTRASAQYFSPDDGYGPDGKWRVQLEIDPYLWLPAVSASAHLGPFARSDISVSSGVPSIVELANHLHFSFMGYAQARWGPLSADINIQYITASGSKSFNLAPTAAPRLAARGLTVGYSLAPELLRVAPGVGLQLARFEVFGVPAELDERAGFSYFETSTKFQTDRDLLGGVTINTSFVQPWFGLRAYLYPSPRWRIQLSGMAQGFGVDGGSWGWGADALVFYAVTDWFNINGGFSALSTKRYGENRTGGTSIDITAFGPVIGAGLRF